LIYLTDYLEFTKVLKRRFSKVAYFAASSKSFAMFFITRNQVIINWKHKNTQKGTNGLSKKGLF
jgi:hypothetical protein